MTSVVPEPLGLSDCELYRWGNNDFPKLDNPNRLDKDFYYKIVNGIAVVMPSSRAGVSLVNISRLGEDIKKKRSEGKAIKHIWRLEKGTVLPDGLVMYKDVRDPNHYFLGPSRAMPFFEFQGLVANLVLHKCREIAVNGEVYKNVFRD